MRRKLCDTDADANADADLFKACGNFIHLVILISITSLIPAHMNEIVSWIITYTHATH